MTIFSKLFTTSTQICTRTLNTLKYHSNGSKALISLLILVGIVVIIIYTISYISVIIITGVYPKIENQNTGICNVESSTTINNDSYNIIDYLLTMINVTSNKICKLREIHPYFRDVIDLITVISIFICVISIVTILTNIRDSVLVQLENNGNQDNIHMANCIANLDIPIANCIANPNIPIPECIVNSEEPNWAFLSRNSNFRDVY